MSINLKKGQSINLRKSETVNESVNNLNQVTIGLGWDINEGSGEYDLDACALLLEGDKLVSDKDIIYYGNKRHGSGQIWSTGDNLTGEGEGDDEQIIAKLNSIPEKYNKIVFYASIYQGRSRGQELGELQNAFIRAVDGNGKEIAKYNISADKSLKDHRSFIFAEAVRNGNDWDFIAVGEAHKTDSFKEIAESYKNGTTERKKLFGLF